MASTEKGAQATPEKTLLLETRIKLISDSVSTALDRLTAQWKTAEQKLRDMLPPREVVIRYRSWGDWRRPDLGEYHLCLGLVKYRGEWRICHGHDSDNDPGPESWKPIVDCSVEERTEAAAHLDKLRLAIVDRAEKSIPEVSEAAEKLEQALAKC